MAFGINSVPIGTPNLECSKEGNYLVQTAQSWYSMTMEKLHSLQLSNESTVVEQHAMRPPCSQASLLLDSSALLWQNVFGVSAPTEETQSSVEREDVLPKPEGADLYTEKSPPLIPDWSVLMHMRTPNPHSLLVQKALSWLGIMDLSDCSVKMSCIVLIGQESFRPTPWNTVPGTHKSAVLSQEHNRAGRSVQASPWSWLVWEDPVWKQLLGSIFKFQPS